MRGPGHGPEPAPQEHKAQEVRQQGQVGHLQHRESQAGQGEEHPEVPLRLQQAGHSHDTHEHAAGPQDRGARVRQDMAGRGPGAADRHGSAQLAGRERLPGEAAEEVEAVGVHGKVQRHLVARGAGEQRVHPAAAQVRIAAGRVPVEEGAQPAPALPPRGLPQAEDGRVGAQRRQHRRPAGGRSARLPGLFPRLWRHRRATVAPGCRGGARGRVVRGAGRPDQ
mmetsp:Transcript_116763/g.341854  ORF Transcript_116763/g.341854 Transcript_116763/m.341854 type:complete len:223 (+) Transcript_116763:307-975(+)